MLLFISSVSTFLTSHAHSQHCLCPGRCRGAACHPHSQTRGRGWRGGRTPTWAAPLAFIGASLKYANKRGKGEKQRVWGKEGRQSASGDGLGPPLPTGWAPPAWWDFSRGTAEGGRRFSPAPQGRFRPMPTSLCQVRVAMLPRQGYILPVSLNFVYFEEKENQKKKEIVIVSIITQVVLKYPFQVMFTLENYQRKVR